MKHSLILHPNDTHIIYPLGSTIVIKNVETTSEQVFLQGHTDRVTCMALSKDGKTLASGQITHMGYLADIILWDVSSLGTYEQGVLPEPEQIIKLSLHKVMVKALDFSCNGQFLASIGGPDDNNLVIWDVAKGTAICGSPAAHGRHQLGHCEGVAGRYQRAGDEEAAECDEALRQRYDCQLCELQPSGV